jgi:DNA helicase-2/ATP-dependent DNA helicase PcrA
VSLILRFGSDYPDARIITLSQNYRSTQKILEAAYEVIRHNRSRADKKLWTQNNEGVAVTISETGTEQDEAMLVADTITREVRTKRRAYRDHAVLYRTNAQSRILEEVFLTLRVPHILVGGVRFYERKEIKDMIAYLRLVLNPRDEISLKRVLNVPARGIGPTALASLSEVSVMLGVGPLDALASQDFQNRLTKRTLEGVRTFHALICEAREIAERGLVTPVLRHVMNRSGYLEELKAESSEDAIARLENLQELLTVTSQYDETAEGEPNLGEFLEQVALLSDVDSLQNDGDAVTLMTLHSAKGLEFPVVFLTGMEEGVFPHSRSLNSESELEEERRLCYVGMTRAREELHMLHAMRRAVFGQPSFNRRSRFLDDIPSELTSTLVPQTTIVPRGMSSVRSHRSGDYAVVEPRLEPPKRTTWNPPFKVGDRVRHAKFGLGVVVACNPVKNDAEVTVAFPGVTGVKKLLQSFAKLEAVK